MTTGVNPNGTLFRCAVCFGILLPLIHTRIFTNNWAVRISGGHENAALIAEKYGFVNMGQIGGLRDYYHFLHQSTSKRSPLASLGNHSLIATDNKVEWIQQQMLHRRVKRTNRPPKNQSTLFNDPQWDSMWYIHCNQNCPTDMNIKAAWRRGYTGKGVVVTILDDGVEKQHPDLKQNYDAQASHDVNGNDPDPTPRYDPSNENKHGTRCAGVVAAYANNSNCMVGIAYNARIGGVRMLDGDLMDIVEAQSLSLRENYIDIYSSSWGPGDDGKTVDGPGPLAVLALENGTRKGRKGRGSIFVWASGNGGPPDHCSCDGYTNSIYTISVSSTTHSGHKPWYLEECSSTLATTYSSGESLGIVTTDLRQRCTDEHSGTSASAPMAAAIIALTLEANPLLTWRDVQHIIVRTSRRGHLRAPDWQRNGAGYDVSHLYGFGLMDAGAMVKEAETWRQVPSQHVCKEHTGQNQRVISPERTLKLVYESSGCTAQRGQRVQYLEHVVVRITIMHPHRGDLSITLTSPSGTSSQLLAVRPNDNSAEGFEHWEFMTTHCWGEKAAGDWILQIKDIPSLRRNIQQQGKLLEWTLLLYGTSGHPYERHEQPRSAEMSSDYNSEEYNRSCDPECSEDGCDGPGPHHCFSCLNYFLKFKNGTRTCFSECPQGFWSERKRCKKCFTSCATCTGGLSNQCSSCEIGYYLDKETSSCMTSCPDGYYISHEEKLCRKCSDSCVKCLSPTVCTECAQGTSLMGIRCQKSCEPGSFYDVNSNACELCHKACATCAAAGIKSCDRCAVGYLMEEWKCVSSCSQGFYPVHSYSDPTGQTQNSCRRCDASCLKCVGPGKGNCSDCVNGYSLRNGVCVLIHDCSTGEYQDESGNCHVCDRTCRKCKGSNNDDCIGCSASRWLDDGQCVTHCPKGKYKSSGQCHVCDHTCAQCVDAGPANCTSCNKDKFGQNRYLHAQQCLLACPETHFSTAQNTCQMCSENCRHCSSATHCLECKSSYNINQGRCTQLECGEGEVKDPEYNECMACEEGCRTCVLYNPKHCLSCTDGYYKYEEGCYKHCPAKTYPVEDTMSCVVCEQGCVSCDAEECHWCETDLFLSDGKCIQECPDGFYGDENTQECENCHKDCLRCSGPGDDKCVSCWNGLVLSSGECAWEKESCPEKTYLTDEHECEACHPSCEVCWGSQRNQCRTCISGRYMNAEELCVTRCPMGSFGSKASGHCESCAQGCALCQDQQHCTRCLVTRKSALYLQDGLCVRQCSRGYPAGTECKSCAPGCASCEMNATHCLSCDQPLLLHKHECVEVCPPVHTIRGGECVACQQDCLQCSEDLCTECNRITFLYNGECVSMCPAGYFEHTEQRMCTRCHSDCKQCSGPDRNNCDSCNDPDRTPQDGACVKACPLQTYRDSGSEECMMCHSTCQTCSGPLDTDCLSCIEGLRTDTYGRCATPTTCPTHHYSDDDGECHLCHKQCQQCGGPEASQCLSCYTGRYLFNTTCVKGCPSDFFGGETQKCEPCHPNCLTCVGRQSHECLSCSAHLYREDKECVETCGTGHYADKDSRVCEQCDESCAACEGADATSCLSCKDSLLFLRKLGRCVASCPDLHYQNIAQRSCELCHTSCRTCTGKGEQDCSSCHPGYTLTEGACKSHCDMGEFPTDKDHNSNCKTCDETCLACKGPGPQNCTSCHEPFILTTGSRCLACCLNQEADEEEISVQEKECCNCTQTTGECVLSTNFAFRNHEEEEKSGNLAIFITTTILLVGGLVTLVVMLIKRSTSKKPPPNNTVTRGYEKLGHGGSMDRHHSRSMTSSSSTYGGQASSSSRQFQEEQLVDLSDGHLGQGDDEDDEDEVDEDIVYMGQDGTVYRKFNYGKMGKDQEDELDYDDESYNFQ
ncbi:proprotein convertase subtilisin/kexin type 5 isoform X2 [Brachyhypopomus gauderio]|uniref:proprotein convertase subtilisin/kexin type 5 isoform X2 n=1 Tax=Brachyhypopomus gauderio TaxID=698409 RepID=UPI004041F953